MYVEQITLEGFKTYMNRTVINGFDPQFNAITGLNGSGKSNILDAIQFLLGSTSKQMLRLKTSLTELIYKQGFAGIEKASVTIKFRCKQKHMRPTGYQNCEQLVVTRQITRDKITKFFVNGQNSNLTKIRNLFRSVQLNIENPHFLVKQGQITKIINLKPLELLGMIEQTAGTAYYNKTRSESEKIIQRKQQKLQSINQILSTTIKPQMDKLEIDRKKYAAFKDKQVLADRLNNKIKKHEYAQKLLEIRNNQSKLSSLKDTIERYSRQGTELTKKLVEIQNQIKLLRTKTDNEYLKDYNHMRSFIQEQQNKRNTIKNRLLIIQKQSLELKQQTKKNESELSRLKQQIEWSQKQQLQAERQIQEFTDLLNDLSKSTSEEEAIKLMEKQIKQEESLVVSLKDEIKVMQGKRQAIKNQQQNQAKAIQEAKENMDSMVATLKALDKDIQHFKSLQRPRPVQDPEISSQELRRLEGERKRIIQENFKLAFNFNDPYPGFNRSLVKGKLFMTFTVKDRNHEKALQIGAGFKLTNIVVQDQKAAQALLKADSFGPYVNIIPNNKIKQNPIRPEILKFANEVAKEKGGLAKLAVELIDFDKYLTPTMNFGFGNFIVCSSADIAREIAFNRNKSLCCKCVTFDGDVYEPGTVTGGSDNNVQYILPKWSNLKVIDDKIRVLRKDFEERNKQFQEYQKKVNEYNLMEKQIDAKISRKDKLTQRLNSLTVNSKPKDYTEELQSIEKHIQQLSKQLNDHENNIKQLMSKCKKGNMRSIQEQKKTLVADRRKCELKLAEEKKKISICEIQIQQITNNMKIADSNQQDYQKQLIQLQRKQSDLIDQIKDNKIQFQALQMKKQQHQRQQALNNNQQKALSNQYQQQKRKLDHYQQSIRQMTNDLDIITKQITQAERVLATILAQNSWLQSQRQIELDPTFNYEEAINERNQILIDVDKLRKTVKVNVDDHSYQKLNEQYRNLLEKKAILEGDKRTLLNNMHELDDKRTKTLESCFKVVKDNLGTIFNDLLPGATAHLSLLDESDVTKGAELRVHFNDVKKELSELSGGQRSLLALSFILALLLYKPSPFYILDEIDSALDLSHTENIGYMISKRFPQSQFLLISLKEGMFQNANVLYKVHFAQGQSKVDRQVLKKKK